MITNEQLANGRKWWIAGGWAACPQLASDQDVWIAAKPNEDIGEVAQKLQGAFSEIDTDDALANDAEGYEDLGIDVVRVGSLDNRHIMVTNVEDIKMFLDAFDISTHQCAITSEMEFVKGHQFTPITAAPIQLRDHTKTPSRMRKIAERYAFLRPVKLRFSPYVVPEPEEVPF